MKLFKWLGLALALLATPALAVVQSTAMRDASYTATPNDVRIVTVNTFSTARTLTLPQAGATQIGQGGQSNGYATALEFFDAANGITATNTLTIAPASGDTINGSASSIVVSTTGAHFWLTPVNGNNWVLAASSTTQLSQGVIRVSTQLFGANGTYTPHAGMLYATIECVGPGGAGGGVAGSATATGTGGGGGAGGYSRVNVSATQVGASQVVTVGTGGTVGTAGNNPGNAGSSASSVGSLCIANAGSGGGGSSGTNSGAGGALVAAGTGDFTIAGAAGSTGGFSATLVTVSTNSGQGGNSFSGEGGPGRSTGGNGIIAQGPGAGGSGGFANTAANVSGGAGGNGAVIITEFSNQ